MHSNPLSYKLAEPQSSEISIVSGQGVDTTDSSAWEAGGWGVGGWVGVSVGASVGASAGAGG